LWNSYSTLTYTHIYIEERSESESLSYSIFTFLCVPWFETQTHTHIERVLKPFVQCCNTKKSESEWILDIFSWFDFDHNEQD
jgi:hypothetical protein